MDPSISGKSSPGGIDYGNFEANLDFLFTTGEIKPKRKILEIGCGKGHMLNHFYKKGFDIHGIEINHGYIEESVKIFGKLPIQHVSSTILPFEDNAFDVVFSMDVFEHILDSDRHLQEVRRVLKNGCNYLLTTPNKWTNTVFETIRWKSLTAWRADHCSLHSSIQLTRRLKKNGFEAEFYRIKLVTPYFNRKIKKYLGKPGIWILGALNIDRLPTSIKPNFYVKARKTVQK